MARCSSIGPVAMTGGLWLPWCATGWALRSAFRRRSNRAAERRTWLTNAAVLSPNARLITGCRLSRLAALAQEIRAVERLLADQTSQDPLVQKLMTLKGVGLVTAVTIRAEIGRFDRFRTGKQLTRFC